MSALCLDHELADRGFGATTRQKLRALTGMTPSYADNLERAYSEQRVLQALSVVNNTELPMKSPITFFKVVLEKGWKPYEKIDLYEYVSSIFSDGKEYKGWICTIQKTFICFRCETSVMEVRFSEELFKDKMEILIQKFLGVKS